MVTCKGKRGLSPIIATVLLVAMVVVLGTLVIVWFNSLTEEAIVKFGKNIELVCDDVKFERDYSDGTLYITNNDYVPIESFEIKIDKGGAGFETKNIKDLIASWPVDGLKQGGTFSEEIAFDANVERIVLIPILIGSTSEGPKTHVCDERHGEEIVLQ
jgi:flagellin-like protein